MELFLKRCWVRFPGVTEIHLSSHIIRQESHLISCIFNSVVSVTVTIVCVSVILCYIVLLYVGLGLICCFLSFLTGYAYFLSVTLLVVLLMYYRMFVWSDDFSEVLVCVKCGLDVMLPQYYADAISCSFYI